MRATLHDNKHIYLSSITQVEEDLIDKYFSVSIPTYGRYVDQAESRWDGTYKRYNRTHKRLARPLLADLKAACEHYQLPLEVADQRPPWKYVPAAKESIGKDYLPGISLEEYQLAAIHKALNVEVGIIELPTGAGKCLGEGTPVLMWDGTVKAVENVIPGDLLMGDDSTPRTVLSTCSGIDDLYLVTQKNGDPYVVNSAHILSLMRTPDRANRAVPYVKVDMPVLDYVNGSRTRRHLHKGYKAAVQFKGRKKPPFDPYILGVWLGDGVSADLQFSLSDSTDADIIEYLQRYCDSNNYVLVKYPDNREDSDIYAIRLYEGIHRPAHIAPFTVNPLKEQFRRLGLLNNKHIPHVFKCGSRQTRLEVLAGLIDSDGEVTVNRDTAVMLMKRGRIPRDLTFLARSLGFKVTHRDRFKRCTTTGKGDLYAAVTISGNISTIPLRVKHKRATPRRMKKNPLVCGITITPAGRGKYFGFEIDGNKRFLLGDFTVTHNTEVIAAICKAIPCPTVIFADQIIIVDQIKERLELRKVVDEAGLFYAGKTPIGQLVIIGSIASTCNPKNPEVPKNENYISDITRDLVVRYVKSGFEDLSAGKQIKTLAPDLLRAIERSAKLGLEFTQELVARLQSESLEKAKTRYASQLKAFKTRLRRAKQFQEIIKRAEMIIVDEADLAVSTPYKTMFRNHCNARRRYGLTGTAFDDDRIVDSLFLREHLGSVIVKVGREEVEAAGRTIQADCYALAFGDDDIHEASTLEIAYKEKVVDNPQFHKLVKGLCDTYPNDGTLILVDRDALGENLRAAIPGSEFIHGKTSHKKRDKILESFEKREITVLIGGKIINRGLDLSGGCENLIITTSGKLSRNLKQKIGRAVRLNKRGRSRVFIFYILNNKYLYDHSKASLRTMVSLGFSTWVILRNGKKIDGSEFIASKFRRPKA